MRRLATILETVKTCAQVTDACDVDTCGAGERRAARAHRFSEDEAAGPPPLPKRNGSVTMAFGDGTKVAIGPKGGAREAVAEETGAGPSADCGAAERSPWT